MANILQSIALFILVYGLQCESRAADLVAYPATLKESKWADGDSFPVEITRDKKKETVTVRLYFVDCPEKNKSSKNDAQRILEQARYFGVKDANTILTYGKTAKTRTEELLSKPFTLHTSFASALGRSSSQRYYGLIQLESGEFLSTVLTREGLTRVHGKTHMLPDKSHSSIYRSKLDDLELAAAMSMKGIWSKSTPEQIVKMREDARLEIAKLAAFTANISSSVNEESPADINNAPQEILEELKGIGASTAKKIIAARPFKSVDDLERVHGIGKATVDRLRKYLICKPMK